jgi:DNA-binding LacI/PurR family transcriptional regulator
MSEMGEEAVRILLDYSITNNELSAGQKVLEVSLIVRESTAPPSA